jgi:hypothetical protein
VLRRTNRILSTLLLTGFAGLATAGASPAAPEVEEPRYWEPCVFYDKGTLSDGRSVFRSIQVERRADGSCPLLDDPCLWADINWDGAIGGSDWVELNRCLGASIDFLQE